MIVRSIHDVRGTPADVRTESWASARLLLHSDGMGFTITDSVLEAGMDETLWYKHHIEACYCLEGRAIVHDLATGATHEIFPGTMYALNDHDRHRIRALTRVRLVCVFVPPLAGDETHDTDGSYPLHENEGE
jgi:L-ectoine synthase